MHMYIHKAGTDYLALGVYEPVSLRHIPRDIGNFAVFYQQVQSAVDTVCRVYEPAAVYKRLQSAVTLLSLAVLYMKFMQCKLS